MTNNQLPQQYTIQWIETHVGGAKWYRYFFVSHDQKQELDRVFKSLSPILKTMPKVSGVRFEYKAATLTPEQNRQLLNTCRHTEYIEGKPQHSFCNVELKKFIELEGKTYDQVFARLHNLQWLNNKYSPKYSQNLTSLIGSNQSKITKQGKNSAKQPTAREKSYVK